MLSRYIGRVCSSSDLRVLSRYISPVVEICYMLNACVRVLSRYIGACVRVLSRYISACVCVLSRYISACVRVLSRYMVNVCVCCLVISAQ